LSLITDRIISDNVVNYVHRPDIHHKRSGQETTLARGRVTLRNFVADYLATGHGQGKAAVIAAFVSPRETLLHYLTARAADIPQADLVLFLRLAERFTDFQAKETKKHADKRLPESIRKNAARLDELLAIITVCDPAIGSGAFPVGMMQEIVRARMALATVEGMPDQTFYQLKRHAIQHSLYGVDLDPGAVEIAKLRLWLSMVVDEDKAQDASADVSALEREIDELVYALYALTPEEIKLVQGAAK